MPVAAPLPPSREQEAATDQPGQQYTRGPPVAERGTGQRGRIRPQQRPIRRSYQQHTASQAGGSSHQLQGDQCAAGYARPPSTRPARPSSGGPATRTTTRDSSGRSATMPPILGRRCSGRSGSASSRTNLLAVWSWTIATGKIGTAFQMLAGFAPCEVWSTYPL